MYPQSLEFCSSESFNKTSEPVKCDDFIFERTTFTETLATELNLVCDANHQTELLGMCLMIGIMIGSLLGGPIGDKLGRKWGIVGATAALGPLIFISGFIPAFFEVYAALTAMRMVCIAIIWVNCFPYVMELFGKEHRVLFYTLMCLSHTLLSLYLPLIAFLARDWRLLHICLGVSVAALVPALWLWLLESPRWLVVNGKVEVAEKMLTKAAATNGRVLLEQDVRELRKILTELSERAECRGERCKLTPFSLFNRSMIFRTLIILSVFVASTFAYYALALNVGHLDGNVFVNFVFSVLSDVPSLLYIYFCFKKIGRRTSIVTAQVILFLCCLGIAFTPKAVNWVILVFYLVGKSCANTTLLGIWCYAGELYPTNLRSQALGTCSLIARILALLAPFMASLGELWPPAPMLAMGTPTIISAVLLLLLPETKGESLIETTEEEVRIRGKRGGGGELIEGYEHVIERRDDEI